MNQEKTPDPPKNDFAKVLYAPDETLNLSLTQGNRIEMNPESTKNGVAGLVLTLVKFIHELLERQAIRRMESDTLSDEEIENIGITLMRQAEEIERLKKEFGLEDKDLNMDLGPLGKLL